MGKKVLLVMNRKLLSDALIWQSAADSRFALMVARDYATAALTAESCSPDITLVEIPESGTWKSAGKCLAICDVIQKHVPNCKQVILCNEKDADSYNAVIQAKRENRIADFLFYDSSIQYLFSKLDALTSA